MLVIVALSLVTGYAIYNYLTQPIAVSHDVVAVVKMKTVKETSCLSKRGIAVNPHYVPYIICKLVDTKEIVAVEVAPFLFNDFTEGDTCILGYIASDEYVYKGLKR